MVMMRTVLRRVDSKQIKSTRFGRQSILSILITQFEVTPGAQCCTNLMKGTDRKHGTVNGCGGKV